VQLAIEGLGHPPQGGERDGVRRLGLLQLAHPRRRDSQALAHGWAVFKTNSAKDVLI